MMLRTVESPRPVPLPISFVVKNGSKMRSMISGGMPVPHAKAAMTYDDAEDGGESEAGAFADFFRGKERFKNAVDDFRGDARSAITYAHQDVRNRFRSHKFVCVALRKC